MFDAAVEAGAKVILGARVKSVDDATITVHLESGNVDKFDLIIGADGKLLFFFNSGLEVLKGRKGNKWKLGLNYENYELLFFSHTFNVFFLF